MTMLVMGLGGVGSASAALLDRGPDLVYDDVLNITWTRNANLPGSSPLRWDTVNGANAWAASLVYAGYDDWRLPYASVAAGVGPIGTLIINGFPCTGGGGIDAGTCSDNELAYMYYYNLGGVPTNLSLRDKSSNQTAVGGQMLTGIPSTAWSGTQFGSGFSYSFEFDSGRQTIDFSSSQLGAWAVRTGDVAAVIPEPGSSVPEPTSLMLFGAGALALGWARRARRGR